MEAVGGRHGSSHGRRRHAVLGLLLAVTSGTGRAAEVTTGYSDPAVPRCAVAYLEDWTVARAADGEGLVSEPVTVFTSTAMALNLQINRVAVRHPTELVDYLRETRLCDVVQSRTDNGDYVLTAIDGTTRQIDRDILSRPGRLSADPSDLATAVRGYNAVIVDLQGGITAIPVSPIVGRLGQGFAYPGSRGAMLVPESARASGILVGVVAIEPGVMRLQVIAGARLLPTLKVGDRVVVE